MQWFSMKRKHALIVMADHLYYSKFHAHCEVQFLYIVAIKIYSNFFFYILVFFKCLDLNILNLLLTDGYQT